MPGPRAVVDAPTEFTPLPYGLLSVVTDATPADPHWQNGITYATSCIVTGGAFTTYDECIAVTGSAMQVPPPPAAKADNVNYPNLRGATPFTVYAEFDCSAASSNSPEEIARRALDQAEPWQVESAFWTGASGGQTTVFPHLAANAEVTDSTQTIPILMQSAAVTVTGSAVKMTIALGLIEEAMGRCFGGRGVVHIPSHALPVLAGAFGGMFTEDTGGRLRTQRGNLIAVGTGYTGSAPAGTARTSPSQTWIYGTGPVFHYQGATRVTGAVDGFDRAENTMKMIAERTHLLGWECCHFAALVDLTA